MKPLNHSVFTLMDKKPLCCELATIIDLFINTTELTIANQARMIPENIKAEDILRAIEEVERLDVIPSGRDSEKYDLEYNGKIYPPKYIISLANKYANGKELDHSEFGGGEETNNFLHSLGFDIIGKQKVSEKEYERITNISQPKNPLSFVGLQNFLLKEMQVQINYQPIMIRTLLLVGGSATKEDIATKIKELNPERENQDFKNIPVYDILEKHGIVTKQGTEFILNSTELTKEERHQLIALCNWKINTMPLQWEELIETFDQNKRLFDPYRLSTEELEGLRLTFVSNYPMERILQLELDEYVPGKPEPSTDGVDKTTFCYRLERELGKLSGIGIRSSYDFGIYYSQEDQKYLYKNTERYNTPQEAFDAIKSEIYSVLEAGKQYNIDHNIDNLLKKLEHDYSIPRKVISKLLSVYYPEDFIQIHSLNQVEIILQSFGKMTDDIHGRLFFAQAKLLEVKNLHAIMKQWSNSDFSHFVWKAIIERKTDGRKSHKDDKETRNMKPIIFVTAYDNENLNRSKEHGILGWKSKSNLLTPNDYVFVFNKSTLTIESCFRIKSKSNSEDLIWNDELEMGQIIYRNRWNAELLGDNLGIELSTINKMNPFNKETFQLKLKGTFPMPLNSANLSDKYNSPDFKILSLIFFLMLLQCLSKYGHRNQISATEHAYSQGLLVR